MLTEALRILRGLTRETSPMLNTVTCQPEGLSRIVSRSYIVNISPDNRLAACPLLGKRATCGATGDSCRITGVTAKDRERIRNIVVLTGSNVMYRHSG